MKKILILLFSIVILNCNKTKGTAEEESDVIDIITPEIIDEPVKKTARPILDLERANKLAALPLACINTEYPNKLSQTLGSKNDLKSPRQLHPAFYGCFDWHSSVHGHWTLVNLLRNFPELENSDDIKKKLLDNISKKNIKKEIEYFEGEFNKTFERTYGWAWLLKLAGELHRWNDPTARELEENLQPLTDLIASKYIEFLPMLIYPQRVGTHTNTAFGMSLAYDYADDVDNDDLRTAIRDRGFYFFISDQACPMEYEPSGSDFLSPCLEQAALMKRLMLEDEYQYWLEAFLPNLKNKNLKLEVGVVADRSDGYLVHLDGLNFSRAWCLYEIAKDMPDYRHLYNIANKHIKFSLPNIFEDTYEGGHWLGSFALFALNTAYEK